MDPPTGSIRDDPQVTATPQFHDRIRIGSSGGWRRVTESDFPHGVGQGKQIVVIGPGGIAFGSASRMTSQPTGADMLALWVAHRS